MSKPIKVKKIMSNPGIAILLLSSCDNNIMDQAGNYFCRLIPNCVYKRQYFMKNLPVNPIMKGILRKHPGTKCVILGNTNKKINSFEDYNKILDCFAGWTWKGGMLNLNYLFQRYKGHELEDKLDKQVVKDANKLKQIIKDWENLK